MRGSFVAMPEVRQPRKFLSSRKPSPARLRPMPGIVCIVAYRPKAGYETELLDLVRGRVPTLRKEGLVTDRVPVIVRAKDNTIIEVRMEIAARDRRSAQEPARPGNVGQVLRHLRLR